MGEGVSHLRVVNYHYQGIVVGELTLFVKVAVRFWDHWGEWVEWLDERGMESLNFRLVIFIVFATLWTGGLSGWSERVRSWVAGESGEMDSVL